MLRVVPGRRSVRSDERERRRRSAGGQKEGPAASGRRPARPMLGSSQDSPLLRSSHRSAKKPGRLEPIVTGPRRPPCCAGRHPRPTARAGKLLFPPQNRLLGGLDLVGPANGQAMRRLVQELSILLLDA